MLINKIDSFNTQPPEGGWSIGRRLGIGQCSFNTQPPEGGWKNMEKPALLRAVSTHSRPKAAGKVKWKNWPFHFGFNTQPPEGGWINARSAFINLLKFQHTAARRRLAESNV